jgi:Na+-translocating ferredoxin:NAD+ oxidoreductase subunit B
MAFLITRDCTGCTACRHICPTRAISGEKKGLHVIFAPACIDCGACGRVCPAGAVANPFGRIMSRVPKTEWFRPLFDLDRCTACGICIDACPVHALDPVLQRVKDLHPYPLLARVSDCMGCGFCAADCLVDAVITQKMTPAAPMPALTLLTLPRL